MTAVLGGLGAALGWAVATLLGTVSSRAIGVLSTLSWVMICGLCVAVPVTVVAGGSSDADAGAIAWLALAGAANVGGLSLVYAGVRRGRVGVVSALTSTEGALAALGAVALGERPGASMYLAFGVVTAGVVMVAAGSAPPPGDRRTAAPIGPSVAFGLAAALVFAVSLLATGEASQSVPAAWATLPARLVGVAIVVGMVAWGIRPVRPGRRVLVAAAAGVFEVAGILAFAIGAREEVGVTAVLASQFAVLVALGGYLFLGESLARRQVAGVAVTAVGVALVAALAA